MSVNLYLNNKVRELPGFKSERYKDNSGDRINLNGMSLFGDKGRLYAMLGDENSEVPEELKEFVENLTFYDSIPAVISRESGIYRYETAEAELECDQYTKKPLYKIQMCAKNMVDIRKLLRLIKTGAIRPDESYEVQQGGKTRRALEAELTAMEQQYGETRAKLDDTLEDLRISEAAFREYKERLSNKCDESGRLRLQFRDLANALKKDNFWPLCYKQTIAGKINAILDGK